MTGRVAQLRSATRFASRLYGEQGRAAWHAYVRRDPFSRLRFAPGRDDPYPLYDRIRAAGPFVATPLGNLASVDHAVCSEVLRGRRFGVEAEDSTGPDEDFDLSFLNRNPPDHTRLRRLVAPAFRPKQVAGYRASIEKTVDGLLDDVEQAGEFDLVTALAAPLPIAVITDLLGIPDADADAFATYGAALGSALSGLRSLRHAQEVVAAGRDLDRIFEDLFALRRREPRDDLISALVAAQDDHLITPAEMEPICSLLLIAGFETTVNLIGNAVNALLDHPDQWAALTADPGLAAAAIQETLRFDPPVQRTARISFDDTEVAGHPVRAGQFVNVLIGGANRDPQVFERPDTFDIFRSDGADHLAFSAGIHHCVGRPIAELEATLAVQALATRLPGLRRNGRVRRRNATIIRGPVTMPVAVTSTGRR